MRRVGSKQWRSAIALSALLVGGCSPETPTQVIARIDAEPSLRAAATSMRVQVLDAALVSRYDESRAASAVAWPASVPISPRTEPSDAAFVVVATLHLTDGTDLTVSAKSHFVAHTRAQVVLTFSAACLSVSCGEPATSTCVAGACRDSCVEPTDDDGVGRVECAARDAGSAGDGGGSGACTGEGTACGADTGVCHDGACCTGCWNGSACVGGGDATACGSGGGACVACPCVGDTCTDGACAPAPDRVADDITAWYRHSCASSATGSTWCWGLDDYGQVGDGPAPGPRPPTFLGTFGRPRINGPWHTCSLLAGARWCWGGNDTSALGLGATASTDTPQAAMDAQTWSDVQTGSEFGCALAAATGELWCWGTNDLGALALASSVPNASRPSPIQLADASVPRFSSFDTGNTFVLGLTTDGTVFGWGENYLGALGRDPASVTVVRSPIVITTPEPVSSVSAGQVHSCVLATSGAAYCWGSEGAWLGPHPSTPAWEPAQVEPPTGQTWRMVRAGAYHSCAIDSRDRLWCWGENDSGALGGGTTAPSAEPVPVDTTATGDNTRWQSVSPGHLVTCGLTTHGAVFCWGTNETGVLGLPLTVTGSNTPARVCLPPSS